MSFSPHDYILQLGRELVLEFEAGSIATTPVLVGDIREKALRSKLEGILGEAVFLGQGCVIDSFGKTSRQQDIVVSERQLGVSFSVAGSDEATYFPCETTICAGEVKSSLDTSTLADILTKCASVKELKRRSTASPNLSGSHTHPFRQFGSTVSLSGTEAEQFSQDEKSTDQIFYFAVCGESKISRKTLKRKLSEALANNPLSVPNLIVTLDGTIVGFASATAQGLKKRSGFVDADVVYFSESDRDAFPTLVSELRKHMAIARTVPTQNLTNYFVARDLNVVEYFGFKK